MGFFVVLFMDTQSHRNTHFGKNICHINHMNLNKLRKNERYGYFFYRGYSFNCLSMFKAKTCVESLPEGAKLLLILLFIVPLCQQCFPTADGRLHVISVISIATLFLEPKRRRLYVYIEFHDL